MKKILKGYIRDFYWTLYGGRFNNPEVPKKTKKIIFICKGNICRSAFAHHLIAQGAINNGNYKELEVDSAGLEAKKGNSSPSTAIQVSIRYGVDLKKHRAQPLSQAMADTTDMLIAMEPTQVRSIQRRYPKCRGHIFLLTEFERDWNLLYKGWNKYHVKDPYGSDAEQFAACFERIQGCVLGLLGHLKSK